MNQAQIRYLKEVLGVEQVLWKRIPSNAPSGAVLNHPRITIFVSKMQTFERELFTKMVAAMKLKPEDILIVEDPTNEKYNEALSLSPIVSLIFGFELAEKLNIQFQRGKFSSENGIPTVVTYGPTDLSANASLKSEAWKDMKLALQRLGQGTNQT